MGSQVEVIENRPCAFPSQPFGAGLTRERNGHPQLSTALVKSASMRANKCRLLKVPIVYSHSAALWAALPFSVIRFGHFRPTIVPAADPAEW